LETCGQHMKAWRSWGGFVSTEGGMLVLAMIEAMWQQYLIITSLRGESHMWFLETSLIYYLLKLSISCDSPGKSEITLTISITFAKIHSYLSICCSEFHSLLGESFTTLSRWAQARVEDVPGFCNILLILQAIWRSPSPTFPRCSRYCLKFEHTRWYQYLRAW
jgi:hypothetical protein